MQIEKLFWDEKTIAKIERKHNLAPHEVEEVLLGKPHLRRFRDMFYMYGKTLGGRYVFTVLFPMANGSAHVVTAREMTPNERKLYKKHVGM